MKFTSFTFQWSDLCASKKKENLILVYYIYIYNVVSLRYTTITNIYIWQIHMSTLVTEMKIWRLLFNLLPFTNIPLQVGVKISIEPNLDNISWNLAIINLFVGMSTTYWFSWTKKNTNYISLHIFLNKVKIHFNKLCSLMKYYIESQKG